MEVRDIFALRKAGRVEEAYQAVSRIYAAHHGPHTSLCLFWCASDLLKQRARERNAPEVRRLLGQMVTVHPSIRDDGRLARAISRAALALDGLVEGFNLVYFVPWFNKLADEDWCPYTVGGQTFPSLGQQAVNRLLTRLDERDAEYIVRVTDLFRVALQKQPADKANLRHLEEMRRLLRLYQEG